MELVKSGTHINFMSARKIAYALSGLFIILSIISLFLYKGLNYGIDFAGGTLIQVRFPNAIRAQDIRNALKPIGLEGALIQGVGTLKNNEFLIRTSMSDESTKGFSAKLENTLHTAFGETNVDVRRIEMVGSTVSKDLKQKGILSLFYAGIGILIYVWWRFELRFSLGAIVALIHDVIITVGIFSITGKEVSLPIIAALLTIVGYSLNDTIVVFDRIRENMKKQGKNVGIIELLNSSINQTLSRTLLTSLTTFLVVFCLFIFGGSVIHNFAFAMLIGVLVGTYSSIFVASPVVLLLAGNKDKKRG
ncbi:MAG: protein translocase subunit SecF [Thermodesulfobacteriota bacterium]|nr:protein translocase subunit SecF [Thermodesulfobacteriota bacterium]